jgi:hypothetical protein
MSHEDLTRQQRVEASSDRAFGLVFAAVFFVIAAWPLLDAGAPRWWAAAVGGLIGLIALGRPALLAGLNRQWIKLGLLLGRIVSPVALGLLFFGVLAPIGALMRLAGKDPLRLKRDPDAPSYWRPRVPPGPPPDSMSNQF